MLVEMKVDIAAYEDHKAEVWSKKTVDVEVQIWEAATTSNSKVNC